MYLGILKHWFVKRNLSFVQFDLEEGSITEIAKTSEQFSVYLLIDALGIGCSVESTRKLSHSIGFEQTERVIAHSLKYGDDEKEIWRYWGGADEGTVELANGVSKSEDSTSLVETDPRTNFKSLTTQPAPMPGVRARSFEGHYLGNRLSDAWIELVSPGWSVRDAKVALGEMLRFSPAIAFAIQSKLWLSAANEKSFY